MAPGSKRRAAGSRVSRPSQTTGGSRLAKRQKTGREFGSSTVDDDPNRVAENNPSSSALSTRDGVYLSTLPSLSTICARAFTKGFGRLVPTSYEEDAHSEEWEATGTWLKALPDGIAHKLFVMLKTTQPRILTHPIITTYFLRGNAVHLDGSLSLTSDTLHAIPRILGTNLRTLVLTDIKFFSDASFASMIHRLPSLEVLNLRNCSKVGQRTIDTISATCPRLSSVNLNNTSVTANGLLPMLKSCPKLEILKLAGLQNLTDATFTKLISAVAGNPDDEDDIPLMSLRMLKHLRSLKLRYNNVSETALAQIMAHSEHLERLDVSFTKLRHIPHIKDPSSIVKLVLTSTFISGTELVSLVQNTPRLRILSIGAMGVKPSSASSLMSVAASTLTDDVLVRLTDALLDCPDIESINLVQNAKLGTLSKRDGALAHFIRLIGRKCKILNLSGIPGLRSADLVGFVKDNDEQSLSPLTNLILNKTNIDDDVAPWISACPELEVLEVAETKISFPAATGLFDILDACYRLSKLNITGCRSVSIGDRRRFFDVWKKERQA